MKGTVTPQPLRKQGFAVALHPLPAGIPKPHDTPAHPAREGDQPVLLPRGSPGRWEQHPRTRVLFPASDSAETLPLVIFFLSLLLLSWSKAEICSLDRARRQNNFVGFSKAAALVK